jgi:hypothetical protein
MIDQRLHREPVPIERERHRHLRVALPVTDWAPAARLNAVFIVAVEFGDVARELPIVFVRTGEGPDGKPDVAPIAMLGITQDRNLCLEGGRWRLAYVPALITHYPFCIGRVGDDRYAVCIDRSWPGIGDAVGEPLFDDQGQPSTAVVAMQQKLERFEQEVQRTRAICRRLFELGLLREMRFDAELPGGRKHSIDGFLTVDEEAVAKLPDATVLELHRQGLLGLIHAHWISLGHVRKLVDWHAKAAPDA